jgi:hypothetical protein
LRAVSIFNKLPELAKAVRNLTARQSIADQGTKKED